MHTHSYHSWWRKALGILAVLLVAGAAFGWAVHALWNWLMPALFGLRSITFWEALGLFVLGKLLFGGVRGFGRGHRHHRHDHHRLHEHWERMSPEEREAFSRGLRDGCSWGRRRDP